MIIDQAVCHAASARGASEALSERLGARALLLERALDELTAASASRSIVLVYVPGRLEVMGKHADYVGGSSIVCAAERGMLVLARPRPDSIVRMTDLDRGTQVRFDLAALPSGTVSSWGLYVLTVLRRLSRNFPEAVEGFEAAFCSDLPSAAGLSSSSALIIACALAWTSVLNLSESPRFRAVLPTTVDLASYLGCVESGDDFPSLPGERGVGTRGGCQDHVAIVCSEPGTLTRWSYRPTRRLGSWALPAHLTFAVISSGVSARKTGAARDDFNRLAAMGAELARLAQRATGRNGLSLGAALTSDADAVDAVRALIASGEGVGFSAAELSQRLDHVVRESLVLVPATWAALLEHDWRAVGEHVATSYEAVDALLGTQVEETRALVRLATELGAVAASPFGAGFGGSVWALISTHDADAFLAAWLESYLRGFPDRRDRSAGFITRPGPAAFTHNVTVSLTHR